MPQTLQIDAGGVRQRMLISSALVNRCTRQELASASMEDGLGADADVPMSRTQTRAARASSPFCSSVGKSEARLVLRAGQWRLRSEGSQAVGYDGLGTRMAGAGAWHVGFGRAVGLSRRHRERRKGTSPEKGVRTFVHT